MTWHYLKDTRELYDHNDTLQHTFAGEEQVFEFDIVAIMGDRVAELIEQAKGQGSVNDRMASVGEALSINNQAIRSDINWTTSDEYPSTS